MKSLRIRNESTSLYGLLSQFYLDVASQKLYYIPLIVFSILSYGFSIFNRTISVDDLADAYYNGEYHGMFAGKRWGMTLLSRTVNPSISDQMICRFAAVCFLLLACFLLSCLFYFLNGRNKDVWQYAVFSSALLTYPLINEIWEYNQANMIVCANFVLVALALLYQLTAAEVTPRSVIISGLILSPVMAGYESGIFTYISLVLIVLLLEELQRGEKNDDRYDWIRRGISYALPLAVALVVRLLVGSILIAIYDCRPVFSGSTGIYWDFSNGVVNAIGRFIGVTGLYYGVNALVYLPITVFLAAVVFFAVYLIANSRRTHYRLPVLLGILTVISLFFQSFIQGSHLPYRTAQPVHLFTAFAFYLAVNVCREKKVGRIELRRVLIAVLLLLCFRQSVCLGQILILNNQRSENEAAIARQIGFRLVSEFDSEKPVYFTGDIGNSKWINDRITVDENTARGKLWYKLVRAAGVSDEKTDDGFVYIDTNVQPALGWHARAFDSQRLMREYLSYLGYDVNVPDSPVSGTFAEYEREASDSDLHSLEIRDMGDHIIVWFGDD